MHKKLTITLEQDVYEGLHRVIGRRRISQFIETLVRPHVIQVDLAASYQELARDEEADREAREWTEGLVGDVGACLE